MAISQAIAQAINQALANAQTAAYQEYSQLISSLDDEFTPTEHRQHYEVEVTSGGNGIDDSADFHNKPIPGTNNFGNVEINSELSAETFEETQDNRENGYDVFDILTESAPGMLISVEQNGCKEYMKSDKPLMDILYCCDGETQYKAIKDMASEFMTEADFAYENQSKNTLAAEINFDENTLTAYNNDCIAFTRLGFNGLYMSSRFFSYLEAMYSDDLG